MKSASRAMAFAAALALHAVLIAVIVRAISQHLPVPARATPVEIRLLRPAAPARPGEKLRPATPRPPQKQTTEESSPPPPKPKAKRQPRLQHSKPKSEKSKPKPKAQAEKHTTLPPPQAVLHSSLPPSAREPAPVAGPAAAASANTPPVAPAAGRPAPAHTGASIPASYAASNAEPPYPRLSRLNEEQGTVMLRVRVKPDGTVAEVRIQSSSGYPLLDRSASTTVRGWRFNPATVDGKPVAEWCQVPVQFTLPSS